MKSKLKQTIAIAVLMSCLAGAAHATEGWYGRLDVGQNVDGGLDGSVSDGATTADFSPDFDDAWMGGLGLGYAFQNGFRLEGELSHRDNDWGPEGVADPVDVGIAGDASALSLMGNLFYEFNRNGRLQPYIGSGVGAARVQVGIDGAQEAEETGVAYQAMAARWLCGDGTVVARSRLSLLHGARHRRIRDVFVTASVAVRDILKYFRAEVEEHIRDGYCRAGVCRITPSHPVVEHEALAA